MEKRSCQVYVPFGVCQVYRLGDEIILFIFRYDEIEGKMTPFLKSSGYNVKKGNRSVMVVRSF
jgi:hypothetical protein